MRRLLFLVPLVLTVPAPASADLCQFVAVDTAATGPVTVANPCVSYDDPVDCREVRPSTGAGGATVIVCRPST